MANEVDNLIGRIQEIQSLIDVEDFSGQDGLDYYNKLVSVLRLLESRIRNQTVLLFNSANITNPIQQQLNNLHSYVAQHHNNKNASYISHINSTLNELLRLINQIPVDQKGDKRAIADRAIKDFETSATAIISKTKQESDGLKQEFQKLQEAVSKLESRIEVKNSQLESVVSELQSQFSNAQEKRMNDFSDKLNEFEASFTEQKNEYTKKYSYAFNAFETEANRTLNKVEGIKKQIEKIYNLVGKESIVGSQKDYADKARKFANWLFWLSIGLMIIFAVVVIWPVLETVLGNLFAFDQTKHLSDLNWEILLYRLPVSALLLLPAIYMANESKKQRDKENKYRELEIKMASIEPYFNNISSAAKDSSSTLPEKDNVKLELAKNLLSTDNKNTEENVIIPKDVLELVKEIVKITTVGKKQ